MPQIKKITATETFVVRQPVLRAGKPLSSCHFEGDDFETTSHFGLFLENEIVGVLSVVKEDSSFLDIPGQYRIRGMAVLENHRKKGYGEALIRHLETFLRSQKIPYVWFNARIIAINFYEKLGYEIVGDAFDMSDIGVHYKMYKKL